MIIEVGKFYICNSPGSWLNGMIAMVTSPECQGPEGFVGYSIWIPDNGVSHILSTELTQIPLTEFGQYDADYVIAKLREQFNAKPQD
jgi:hypothetical protein